jgi:hypothetical protein
VVLEQSLIAKTARVHKSDGETISVILFSHCIVAGCLFRQGAGEDKERFYLPATIRQLHAARSNEVEKGAGLSSSGGVG